MRIRVAHRLATVLCLVAFGFVAAACGDDPIPNASEVCDNAIDDDGNNLTDCDDPACSTFPACGDSSVPQPDSGTPDGPPPSPDMGEGEPALEAVLSSLRLPSSATEFAQDVDGNGTPDNQLGALIGGLAFTGQTAMLQGSIDGAIADGSALLLFAVLADALDNAAPANVSVHLGEDTDLDPSNNFSGSAEFTIDPLTPPGLTLSGGIRSGSLLAQGSLLIVFPTGVSTAVVTIKNATLLTDVSSTGMSNGQLSGAIPWTEIDEVIFPAIEQMMAGQELDPLILSLIGDTNGDGQLSAEEIRNSSLVQMFVKPDVDLDGDGAPDAMSVGAGFQAVSCNILQ